MVRPIDCYRFDLNGFLHLPAALDSGTVAACNAAVDAIGAIPPNHWHGHVHSEPMEPSRGVALQQIYELPAFQPLIDHPAWIDLVRHFIGGLDGFDGTYGDVFIDENFISQRGPHQAIGIHSGGDNDCKRTSYRVHNGKFMCMQINILIALRDIGPGDGATMVIPGSHKSNFRHPDYDQYVVRDGRSVDGMTDAIEVHLAAGDAILFTDAIAHGSARRLNPGERRIAVFRYAPAFTFFRYGYRPSASLLASLSPAAQRIVFPFRQWQRQPNLLPVDPAEDDPVRLQAILNQPQPASDPA